MKKIYLLLFLNVFLYPLFGQQETVLVQGTASYVSSQNVYVKFPTTEGIEPGDTLFTQKEQVLKAALVVKDRSSTSAVCNSLLLEKVNAGDTFFARIPKKEEPKQPERKVRADKPTPPADSLPANAPVVITPEQEEKPVKEFKQKIRGRLYAASYSNFFRGEADHRLRYAFTMQGNNIGNSRFSTDAYVTFRHTAGEWNEVKEHLADAIKVYSLAVKYDLDKQSSISFGRKINQRISSMGAIDGLQVEKGFGNFMVGGIAGSRPNFEDYGFDVNLLQAGAYIGHAANKDGKMLQSTLAFVEQRNGGATDRRFLVFQHSSTPLKALSLFGSMEIDLFENIHSVRKNTVNLTNLFLSLRYNFSKKANLSVSYDNRKNIIYYESYKSYIDQLIEDETRQGLRLNVSYRPAKFITCGANLGWRFQKSDLNLSENLNAYLNFSRMPWLKAAASLTANFLRTNYLDSKIFGIRLSKEILPGRLNGEVYYRWLDYHYRNYENHFRQQIAGADVSLNLTRKLAFHLYYEGTFDKQNDTFTRLNTKIIQRF